MRESANPTEIFEGRPVPGSSNGARASDARARVWRLQFGPCWCRGVPPTTGSFDFVRLVTSEDDLGQFGHNILIVSERVIDGSLAVYRQVIDRIPDPKLVVSVAPCPAARSFWDELPVGWSSVSDVLPVDIQIDDCISGMPESLMAAVLRYATSADTLEDHSQEMAISMGG